MLTRASLATFLVPAALTAGASFTACSSSSTPAAGTAAGDGGTDAASCSVYTPPSTYSPTSPTISFTQTVMPIFAAHGCGVQSCHGSTTAPQGDLYLGDDAAAVYANLIGVAAMNYPQMSRVKAGDPASSYLQFRVDGDACTLAGCTTLACYELMPQGGPELDESLRLQIRGWIAQGAISDVPDAGPQDAAASDGSPDAADAGTSADASDDASSPGTSDGASTDASGE